VSSAPITIEPAEIEAIKQSALVAIAGAQSLDQLKEIKIAHVGDRSPIARANQSLAQVAMEQRAATGKLIGTARANINQAFDDRERELTLARDAKALNEEKVDVTLPTARKHQGALHPLTSLRHEIEDLFVGLGYQVAEGPELESSWLNFDALNIPEDHPARSMQDTFFIQPADAGLVLRTHTSPVQVRTMLENEPPIYVICPGRTYRSDELDATHTPVFTEPSAEVDFFYNGRWVEWGGCGMVNPKVLQACGIDTSIYTGFAFGMGLERTLMVRNGITDMHDIVEGDIRFSRQFGTGTR
jgi:phenylalanyl-tRNA synthetase alpha chain